MTLAATRPAAEPSVSVHAPKGPTTAVVIVLPGGRADSFEPASARQLTRLRMAPFARALARSGEKYGLEVWSLRYRYRGWNGSEMSPVADARWALEEVQRRHGDVPVVLVGHSMGGRTALRVAGAPAVAGVVALAPWLNEGEPVEQLRDRDVLIAHGTRDTITSANASERFARRLQPLARSVHYVQVRGEMHAMLFRARAWHRLTTGYVLDLLGAEPLPPDLTVTLARGYL